MSEKKVIIKTVAGKLNEILPYNKDVFNSYFIELKEFYEDDVIKEIIEDEDISFSNSYGDSIRIYTINKKETLELFNTIDKILNKKK